MRGDRLPIRPDTRNIIAGRVSRLGFLLRTARACRPWLPVALSGRFFRVRYMHMHIHMPGSGLD